MTRDRREVILVVGMHRSGTSALAGALGLAGAVAPLDAMPPVAENPRGCWESRSIVRTNNDLLRQAAPAWNDDSAIAASWFAVAGGVALLDTVEPDVRDAALRHRLGRAARLHALARFGFGGWSRHAARTYADIRARCREPAAPHPGGTATHVR